MSRHLTILALVAAPLALAACDAPSTLSKAKPGECYAVVGRDSVGAPKLAKTACAGSAAALASACPTPAPTQAAVCTTTGTSVATAGGGHRVATGHVKVRTVARHRVQATRYARISSARSYALRDDRVARSGEVTSLGLEYARVGEELAGGYDRRETYSRAEYAPPAPAPAARHSGGASVEYSERSRRSGGYSESYSSSSSSSSSHASRGGYGRVECDCENGGRGQPPHSPFDGYGYLTWRGKTPG